MTDSAADKLPLAAEFPAATHAQWRALVERVLKGALFQALIAKTYDDIAIEPLFQRDASARPIAARTPGAAWAVMQRADHPDPATANADALHDLENGATALSLVFAGAVGGYGYGLPARKAAIAPALEAGAIALGAARRLIYFRVAADTDQLMTMAKLHALRKLWARVEDACGLTPAPTLVVAETAWRMMTQRDPHVNMLRATIATLA